MIGMGDINMRIGLGEKAQCNSNADKAHAFSVFQRTGLGNEMNHCEGRKE